jgi:hypothetical protein
VDHLDLALLPILPSSFGVDQASGWAREIEGSLDIYNVTNENTPFNARPLTTLSVRQNGDPSSALIPIQQFLSPSARPAPRIVRFGVTIKF